MRAAIALCCLLSVAPMTRAAQEMRLSFILDESSDWYEGCRVFKELVEQRTSGEMQVRVITNAQLSGNSQATELEMLTTGGLEGTLESSILLTNLNPAMEAFTEPWRFADHDEAEAFADGPEGQRLLESLEDHGVIGLAWGTNGFRQLTNSRHPVQTPEDLRGLRVRVADSRQFIDIFRRLGADPVTMNFGELITALQTGAVDAQENPLSVIWSRRLFEVQRYLTLWNMTYDPIALCVNAAWLRQLAPGTQRILRDSAREAMHQERRFSRARESEMLTQLRREMIVAQISSGEINTFRQLFRAGTAASPTVTAASRPSARLWVVALLALLVLAGLILFAVNTALSSRGRRD
jgi:tripartite ATP-independent transporter DctP family solute receptor